MIKFSKYITERKKVKAGILLYHFKKGIPYVFLVAPGGPYFKNKTTWNIPKGGVETDEILEDAAKREFEEETGIILKNNPLHYVGVSTKNKSFHVFAAKGSGKEKFISSNMFELEWPPKSGKIEEFPEIKDGKWFKFEDMELIRPEIYYATKEFIENL